MCKFHKKKYCYNQATLFAPLQTFTFRENYVQNNVLKETTTKCLMINQLQKSLIAQ